ncbi:amidohydrolase [Streptomyces sp.]|uniref:amidohydrolase n=1 Tax=Streptomyces sp. TaxID=1931 RepID=UPI002F3E4664
MSDTQTLRLVNATVPPGPWVGRTGPGRVTVDLRGGRISAVTLAGERPDGPAPDRVIDLAGAHLLPGFVDSHTHLGWAAEDQWTVNWAGVTTRAAALARVRTVAARVDPGLWVTGGGWLPGTPAPQELPDRTELDRVSGDHPLLLVSRDRSTALLNSRALALCRIDRHSADPPGGRIERDEHGDPTGRLTGEAVWGRLALGVVPPPNRHRRLAELRALLRDMAARGITEVHDIATVPREDGPAEIHEERSFTDVRLLAALADRGELTARVSYRPSLRRVEEPADLTVGDGGGLIGFAGYKLSLDNGWFSQPPGQPRIDSFRYPGLEQAVKLAAMADTAGAPTSIHAMGDLGVAEALDLYGCLPGRLGTARPPHRLIHARRMSPADIARCAGLGVVVEAQPWEVIGAGPKNARRGDEAFGAMLSPFRSLLDAGVTVSFGSDRRIGMRTDLLDADPLTGVQIAVTRQDPTEDADSPVWQPEQRITVTEALACATVAGVRAAGAAYRRGRIEPGHDADLTVLGGDPRRIAPGDISTLPVLLTVSAGRIVHEEVGA